MILVLNIGLKNARCIVFSYQGEVLAHRSQPVKSYLINNRVEQKPSDWWDLSRIVIKEAICDLKGEKESIEFLTVTTSASCLVVLDKNKNVLRNSILVSDGRSAKEASDLGEHHLFKEVYDKTGIKSSPDLMLPKIIWLSKHEPSIFNNAKFYLNIGDYLYDKFTGEIVTDPNNALKYHYDITEKRYPDNLLDSLNIPNESLPKVVPQGTNIGKVLSKVSDDLGIPQSCDVIISTYDALVAVVGSGAFEVGDAVDISGTVTSVRLVTDRRLEDPKDRIYVAPHFDDNYWLCGGSNNLGGGRYRMGKTILI